MPEIGLFEGIHFNPRKVNLENTILRLENLVSLLEYEKERIEDNRLLIKLVREVLEKKEKARNLITEWEKEGFLLRDTTPTIYIYHQIFEYKGIEYTRKGWIAPCLLEPLGEGKIYPHESTFSCGTEKHLHFLRAVQMNLTPVLVLYSDPEKRVDFLLAKETKRKPLLKVRDEMGSEHVIWPIKSRKILKLLSDIFLDRPLVIADGHHRYEASLRYRDEITIGRESERKREAYLFRLMTFSNVFDGGIVILPTHRHVIPLREPDWKSFYEKLSRGFRLRRMSIKAGIDTLPVLGEHSFGLYRGGDFIEIFTLKREDFLDEMDKDVPEELKFLDVVILHHLFFKKFLHLGPDDTIQYVRNAAAAIKEVRNQRCGFLFLLNPPSPFQVFEIAKTGKRMPPKSTDFYPKLVAGLLMMDVKSGNLITKP